MYYLYFTMFCLGNVLVSGEEELVMVVCSTLVLGSLYFIITSGIIKNLMNSITLLRNKGYQCILVLLEFVQLNKKLLKYLKALSSKFRLYINIILNLFVIFVIKWSVVFNRYFYNLKFVEEYTKVLVNIEYLFFLAGLNLKVIYKFLVTSCGSGVFNRPKGANLFSYVWSLLLK